MKTVNKNDINAPVGILDSGVGGLTAAAKVIELFPHESVVYIGDSANMPYGNRSPEQIVALADRMIAFLEEKGVKTVLLACNTISSFSERLTAHVPLINIVEAGAMAVAEQAAPGETVGLIATKATVSNRTYEKKLASLRSDVKITSSASVSLPKIIDSQMENIGLLNEKIKECIDPIVHTSPEISKLILGCSHFPIISREISAVYPQLTLIDPAEKQARLLQAYLEASGLVAANGRRITLYTTAETYEYAAAVKRLGLEIDALIKVAL